MRVDWQVYYDAAKKCQQLAEDIRRADKPVHEAVKGSCAGMAGKGPGCTQWGESYDTAARNTLQASASLANALTNYGAALYAQGYNWGVANKSDPRRRARTSPRSASTPSTYPRPYTTTVWDSTMVAVSKRSSTSSSGWCCKSSARYRTLTQPN